MGVEQTLEKNQPECSSLMCINSTSACAIALYRNINTDRALNFQHTPDYINTGCS